MSTGTGQNLYYSDTDEEDFEEVERLLFEGNVLEETNLDSSFSTVSPDTNSSSFWSQSPIDGVDTSFATTVDDGDFKCTLVTKPLAPSFGFLKSTEECLEDVARTVKGIQNPSNHWSLHRVHQPVASHISHVRSLGCVRRNLSHPLSPHPYSGRFPSRPLYWKNDKSGDLAYVAIPARLLHIRQVGNQWTYSLTGPWYPRTNPVVGDIHFSPSEVTGFDYWVYARIGNESVWCLTRLSQSHPLTNELILQHLSVNSPPQWALSWPGLDIDFLCTPY